MRKMLDLRISISGIRGKVGENFTPSLIIAFSEAFATYMGGGRVAVGYDTRPTRDMVKHAVFAGLLSCGAIPIDVGILPIPSFQVYVREVKTQGGIAITASHNPMEWNALKLVKRGGFFPFSYEAEEILDIYYQGRFNRVEFFRGSVNHEFQAFRYHFNRLLNFANVELIKKRRPKVVVDACNGAASPYVKDFLESLGCEVIVINGNPDALFPRPPEPLPENLGQLSEAVLAHGADVGFAQDADADRLAAVDENGIPVGEEYTLALAVEAYLKFRRKSPVVINLSTSRAVEDIAIKEGVSVKRTRVGEINVVEEMMKTKARIGGEGNGGIIVPEVHPCRDSFSGMILLLEYISRTGKPLSTLKAELPGYYMRKDKIEVSLRDSIKIVEHFKKKHREGKITLKDGVRIDHENYWLHLRPSNTEPVLRLIVEAKTMELMDEIFQTTIKEIQNLKEE